MRRLLLATGATLVALMLVAPAAFAVGGEGLLGETDDSTVTWAGLALIVFFPVFIGLASLLQWHLEKRKHARYDAQKAREQSSEWRGGW
ncbi:MAG: hypothetical protein ABSC56_02435 [Solirubrobacteraceae bacterium]